MGLVSRSSPRGRAALMVAGAAAALCGSTAMATPVNSVQFSDGKVLDVSASIGSGTNSAYLAVNFSDGLNEAFQYNYTGSLNGYSLLTAVEAATTLRDVDTYYPSFSEHFISYITDGANTTAQYPALYYTPPAAGDTNTGTGAQGLTFEQAQVGADLVNVTNGEVVAFDNSYSAVPVLPETAAVPEPTVLATGSVVLSCALIRRRRRRADRA